MIRHWLLSVLFLSLGAWCFQLDTRIYPVNQEVTLRFKAVSPWAQKNINRIQVQYIRDDSRFLSDNNVHEDYQIIPPQVKGDELSFVANFNAERRHTLVLRTLTADRKKTEKQQIFHILSLEPELFALRPFKGNIHQHSKISDGAGTPQQHVAYARMVGFDFLSVTDHRKYEQNAMAIDFAKECQCGLDVYAGEEMHNLGTKLHTVALGATKKLSSNKPKAEGAAFEAEVNRYYEKLMAEFPQEKQENLYIASALATLDRARKDGAFIIYCHPQWHRNNRNHYMRHFHNYIFRNFEFDAVEIMNGQVEEGPSNHNLITAAELYELSAERGKPIPVTAGSDCHNPKTSAFYGNIYCVIFAKDATLGSFTKAVKEYRSVASSSGKDRIPLFFGPSKFVKYAYFLVDAGYWEKHDELCMEQTLYILRYLNGEKEALKNIKEISDKIQAYRENFFYK